jgi:hypothetical protein
MGAVNNGCCLLNQYSLFWFFKRNLDTDKPSSPEERKEKLLCYENLQDYNITV